jgi:hypothetical protein
MVVAVNPMLSTISQVKMATTTSHQEPKVGKVGGKQAVETRNERGCLSRFLVQHEG